MEQSQPREQAEEQQEDNQQAFRSFVPAEKNPADATIAGFVYQTYMTMFKALNLQKGVLLVPEYGEDIDLFAGDQAILDQLKHLSNNVTLRHKDVLKTLAHAVGHLQRNAGNGVKVHVLFTSNAVAGKEDGTGIKKWKGIEVWNSVRTEILKGFPLSETCKKEIERLKKLFDDSSITGMKCVVVMFAGSDR
jgi:hypothetical protein